MRESQCGKRSAIGYWNLCTRPQGVAMRNSDERTPQEFKQSEERLAGGSHASDRRESQCGMWNAEFGIRNAECGIRNSECGIRSAEFRMRSLIAKQRKISHPVADFCNLRGLFFLFVRLCAYSIKQCEHREDE